MKRGNKGHRYEPLTRKDVEGEIDLCRHLLVISMRDASSVNTGPKYRKARAEAARWMVGESSATFSFENVATYTFGDDVDIGKLRNRVARLVEHSRSTGQRILSDVEEED